MQDKNELRNLFKEYKEETLIKNSKIIDKYKEDYMNNLHKKCNLLNGDITLEFCETIEQKQKWLAYTHLTNILICLPTAPRQGIEVVK